MRIFGGKMVLAVSIVFSLPGILWAMSSSEEPGQAYHPQIRETRGSVMVKGAKYSIWEPAERGMLLLAGDILRTEKGGFARIEFASGIIELYETTVLAIPSIGAQDRKKDIQKVIIEEGKTLFDINPLGVERGFEFRTKNIQGGVKGTMFTVSYLEGGTSVNVYRGVVRVSDLERSESSQVELLAGNAVRVEKRTDFRKLLKFDPELTLDNYRKNIPPSLDGKGFPADYNANPANKGVRKRGAEKSGSSE
ncbi:MAG: FecR family protein [bacterium]|nr:FecR family protein [bacterium]MDT8366483.1 FecR family protein [bacterium]